MIKKVMSSKKGASSIMVILLLVVLVVFGIAALTTALSNFRLGQKVSDWNTKYYAAEGDANERFAMIDKAVEEGFSTNTDNNAQSIAESVESLGFDTDVDTQGGVMTICFETWSEDIGIAAVLELDLTDMHSLHAVQWKEIQ